MPLNRVSYLDRPVREGVTDLQRKRLRKAAVRALSKNPNNPRAMLILRLNQPRVTWEEAWAQARRVEQAARKAGH